MVGIARKISNASLHSSSDWVIGEQVSGDYQEMVVLSQLVAATTQEAI